MEQSKYDELLKELKIARENSASHKQAADEAVKTFKINDVSFLTHTVAYNEAQLLAEKLDTELRAAAVADYTANGIKKPHPKVTVKTFRVFKILDMAKVREWVDSKLPDALVMDLKKVEKYAKEIGPVEGTTINEEPRAEIASALD